MLKTIILPTFCSEAFTPDNSSPADSESLRLGSTLGEGEEGVSVEAESSLGVGEEDWVGSDVSVGEPEEGKGAEVF